MSLQQAEEKFISHMNHNQLPLTLVVIDDGKPVGMGSLRSTDGHVGLDAEFTPWIGSVVVEPLYRKRGIGGLLLEARKQKALELGYTKLYLLTFDTSLPSWYAQRGWKIVMSDNYNDELITVMSIGLVK
jgi:N-acetylglutamate synthase-like GNAT family acetyltransferase